MAGDSPVSPAGGQVPGSGCELSAEETERLLTDWDSFRRRYLMAAEHIDLLLTPTTRTRRRCTAGSPATTSSSPCPPASPAVTVPAGRDPAGLSIGVQLIGRPWEDHRVLAAARLVEAVAG